MSNSVTQQSLECNSLIVGKDYDESSFDHRLSSHVIVEACSDPTQLSFSNL